MKNFYEETLFRIEDERFEIDINIERFKAVIRWFERLEDPAISASNFALYCDKIKKFQVVELIYGTKTEEIFKGIENHKSTVIPIVKKRIEEKLEVIKDSKYKYENENWSQNLDACFHRSLDQNSVSIKFYDKKILINKSTIMFN